MERMGPKGGDAVHLNLLVAGDNRGEVDYIGSQIMGFSLHEVRHLQYYIESNDIKIDDTDILGEKLERIRRPFAKVKMDGTIPKGFNIYNTNACSSCMNAFLLSCQFLEKDCPICADVFMGEKTVDHEKTNRLKIAFGNCCIKGIDNFDDKIPGCPPYPFILKNLIEKRIK
jgi:hypothetical protein